eukprot:COSAG03_NODE_3758_length_1843_cov_9.004014_3_plen_93_part_00
MEPEPQQAGGTPSEGVPPGSDGAELHRQSTVHLVASLRSHLMDEIGISYHKAAEAYAARLFEEGYDSPFVRAGRAGEQKLELSEAAPVAWRG